MTTTGLPCRRRTKLARKPSVRSASEASVTITKSQVPAATSSRLLITLYSEKCTGQVPPPRRRWRTSGDRISWSAYLACHGAGGPNQARERG